jgi:8-amino-7-oxononanoate synthase
MAQDPLAWIDDELNELDRQHLRRQLFSHTGPQAARIEVGGRPCINFSSNDYLALAADPRLAVAAETAAREHGFGAGASPLVTGRSAAHATLERRLAEFENTEAALVFTSGFAANSGTIAAMVDREDAVFADAKNHASLIDGCRLSRAAIHVYRHGDADHLRELLADSTSFRRRLIVSDSLFSMDGDFAPIEALCELAEKFDAMLMLDEAHATGVFGQHGRGVCEMRGVEGAVHIRIGTLSKALGAAGGFVAGRQLLIDWLANRARSYVFSTAFPPPVAAAAIAALNIVRDEPQRRAELLIRAKTVREKLIARGLSLGTSESQIVPVYIGDAERTMKIAHLLRESGLLVPGIRPPSVPAGEALLRISLNWAHTPAMIDELVAKVADCWGRFRPL